MRLRGLVALAAAAAFSSFRRGLRPSPRPGAARDRRPGLLDPPDPPRRLTRHPGRSRYLRRRRPRPRDRAQLPPLRARRRPVHTRSRDRERHLDRDVRRGPLHGTCATRTRPRCAATFVAGNPPPNRLRPHPDAGSGGEEAAAHGRPDGDDHAPQRGRQGAPRLTAGNYTIVVRDRSKLHNAHLVGKGVNRKSGLAATGTADVEGEALSRPAPLLLRSQPEDGQGLDQGHVGASAAGSA